jgi:hypothetical protein
LVNEGNWTQRLLWKLKISERPPQMTLKEYSRVRAEFQRKYGTWSLYACEDILKEASRRGINRWQVYGERAWAHYEQLWWNSFITVWGAIGQANLWGPAPMPCKLEHSTKSEWPRGES